MPHLLDLHLLDLHLLDLHVPDLHWLSLFGAVSLGIVVGWLTYLFAATRWDARPIHIVIVGVAIGVLLLIAKLLPARYGYRLELGVVLAVVGSIGCFVGWALRDLADFVPPGIGTSATASAAATGSYLFRDALAGTGAGPAYMRGTMGPSGPARVRIELSADTRAPVPGGYTFPKTLPFADATTSRRPEAAMNGRRHWTWSTPAKASDATTASGVFAQADHAKRDRP